MTTDTIRKESSEESSETVQSTSLQSELDHLKLNSNVEKTIRRHVAAASSIGLFPLPLIDMAALLAVQINLIRKIAKAYNVSFTKNKVVTIATSLISAVLPSTLTPSVSSAGKLIPLIGQTAGAITMPVLAGAVTYATGRVFVTHFESGGTFLNFDAKEAQKRYAEMFKKGKDVVAEMKEKEKVSNESKVADAVT
ncbi:MAG: Uncharacterized conserved protein, DUF697 family [Candidatus Kentron sp. G]|nr:MAG: Uncharacterized conserved protein, DUF697 family [Candidatus Kentron sp. G]VFN02895.1 MAG: Uncharacterized conserved protein, DUF697 family [Candidatus Kentron sp. G]VFN04363.1 MAG: Uncharacterized conserved protein, DUF697 family [Candidatus Kentron sp. G]